MKFGLASALLLIAFSTQAVACSCAGDRAPCQAYWEASAIFVGTVTFTTTTKVREAGFELTKRLVRFRVDQPLRNVAATEIEVVTGFGEVDCGYDFRRNRQYLVYAYRNKDQRLATTSCTRTRLLSAASADLEYIRGLSKANPGERSRAQSKFDVQPGSMKKDCGRLKA